MKSARPKATRANRSASRSASAARPSIPPPAQFKAPPEVPAAQWTFLTNHSHVLVLLARNSSMVLREVAARVGITERAVQRIIADLEAGGVIEREKIGRQNHYRILSDQPLRHPIESHRSIGDLLELLSNEAP
ncbi:helix-turn-helix transcriptional regulator [Planctomicrobium piriforme]|nr:winged helix-turn-helix transcriptional regulator [Planctomicrobium piriforme]